jgi:hypothetical protein
MKNVTFTFLICLLTVSFLSGQSREKTIDQLKSLKDEARKIEESLMLPDKADVDRAKVENLDVFRILPREKYDIGSPIIRGGGAYYSFTSKLHSYDKIPQLELSGNQFSVGFAGADYGYIVDLGNISLSNVTNDNEAVDFLLNYKPPILEPEIRIEQRNSPVKESNGIKFQRRLAAVVGHTYILRSISFSQADVLVAFFVLRKDEDGSVIILWKKIKDFEKPILLYQTDAELTENIKKILEKNGFTGIAFDVKDGIVRINGRLERINEITNLITTLRTNGISYF